MPKPKHKWRKRLLIFLILLLAAGGAVWNFYFRNKNTVLSVQVEPVERRNLTERISCNGRIHPVLQVKISPEVSGEIIELPVKEGQDVKKGDLLMKIKPDFYKASRNQAEASYKSSLTSQRSAAANLKKAEVELKRQQQLIKERLITESVFLEFQTVYEVAKQSLEGAEHQVEVAQAQLARAEEDLAKTTVYSPLNGTVTRLSSQLGERVVGTATMAGTDVMTISDLNAMEARVDIGEMDVVLIDVGQTAHLEVDAFRDRKFLGKVTEIANSSKGLSVQGNMGGGQTQEAIKFEVKIRVVDKVNFRPGMSVSAEIETRFRTNVVAVPIQSVTTRLPKGAPPTPAMKEATNSAAASEAGEPEVKKDPAKAPLPNQPVEVVFVLEGNKVKMVPVKVGISDDSHTEILEGLTENQKVVTGGFKAISNDLEDGKIVQVGPGPRISAPKSP